MSSNPRIFRDVSLLSSFELEAIAARDLATPIAEFNGQTAQAHTARDRRMLLCALDAMREEHQYLRSRIDVLERALHRARSE